MKGSLKDKESLDLNAKINQLEMELRSKESTIEVLQERLNNNKDMLQDVIAEKKQLNLRVQGYDLNLIDAKLNQYQKLQEDHQKMMHRLQVTKNHLDDANQKIKEANGKIDVLEKIIVDLGDRGLLDYIRGRYPESYRRYKEK